MCAPRRERGPGRECGGRSARAARRPVPRQPLTVPEGAQGSIFPLLLGSLNRCRGKQTKHGVPKTKTFKRSCWLRDYETPRSPPYAKAQCRPSERGPTAAPPSVTGPQDCSSQAGHWGSLCTGSRLRTRKSTRRDLVLVKAPASRVEGGPLQWRTERPSPPGSQQPVPPETSPVSYN